MLKVARLFEEEKQQAVTEAKKENSFEIAKNLLDILSIDEIAKRTGLTVDEVRTLAKSKEN